MISILFQYLIFISIFFLQSSTTLSLSLSLLGNYPPFTQSRAQVIAFPKLNGGTDCPPAETRSCVPDVCYSAKASPDSTFGAERRGMRPLRTLPLQHPAYTRTDCGGPLPSGSLIPAVDAVADATGVQCTGPALFYALDEATPATGKTNSPMVNGKDATAQLFFMQDENAQLYFGMMNGAPNGKNAYMNIDLEFTGIDGRNKGVTWAVQNDADKNLPASGVYPTGSKCSTLNNDCYEWDLDKKTGKAGWSWKPGKTSGGIMGPLPSYSFCAEIKIGDMGGVNTFEFAARGGRAPYTSYLDSDEFPSDALDKVLEICTYPCSFDAPPPTATGGGTTNGGGNGGGAGNGGGGGAGGGGNGGGAGAGAGAGAGGAGAGGDGSSSDGSTSDGSGSGTSSGTSSGSGEGTSTSGSGTSTGGGVIVTPATCSTGKVNAAGDGCAPTCSTGEVNTAGDACAPSCTTGAVNAAGDGCAPSCTTGAINAAGDGCTDPDATFDKPGTFETPGEYTPPGEFTHAKDADGNDVANTGGDTNKDGNAAVLWGVIGGACFLLLVAALLLIQHRRKKPSSTSTKNLPKGWEMFVDPASGYPCYVDPKGDTHWDLPSATGGIEMQSLDFDSTHCENPMRKAKNNHHSRNSTQLPDGWDKDTTGEGDRFYIERESGLTTWDAPKGSTGGSTGVAVAMTGSNNELAIPIADGSSLPKGWTEHVTEDGDTMYYNKELDETRWDMPNS